MSAEREIDRLIRLFEKAEEEIEKDVLDAIERGARYTAVERETKRAEISALLDELRTLAHSGRAQDASGPAWNLVREAYREGAEGTGVSLGAFSQIDQDAAEVVYANLSGQLDDAIAAVGRRVDDAFRRVTLAETLSGIIGGTGRREISAGIEEGLRELGIKAFTDAGGRTWNLANYAKMAARTARTEASSYGALNRIAGGGIDLVDVINVSACDVCRPFVGTYSISGRDADYPALTQIPPFHPNCGCVLAASRKGVRL